MNKNLFVPVLLMVIGAGHISAQEPEMDPRAAAAPMVTTMQVKRTVPKTAQNLCAQGMEKFDAGEIEAALTLLAESAEQGYVEAQYNLGLIHLKGMGGVERNPSEAARWFEMGALNGDAESQYQIGMLYLKGNGVEADSAKARSFLQDAAAQNHERAARILTQLEE